MEFFKRHYEKVILLGLLLFFILTMIHVLSIVGTTNEITAEDLRIPPMSANYEMNDPADDRFNIPKVMDQNRMNWSAAGARDQRYAEYTSDLVQTFPIAKCPFCNRIIPRYFFFDRDCPECGKHLLQPPAHRRFIRVITADDFDGDGISNVDEQKFGFNPYNPDDALYDADGDGFSNVYEIANNTNPLDPLSRPPLWMRLRFIGVETVELPLRFSALTVPEGKENDKASWTIQLATRNWGRRDSLHNKKLGEEIYNYEFPGEKRRYRIADVELIREKGETGMVDKSKLYLEEILAPNSKEKPDRLVMVMNEVTRSNDRRPIFEDVGEWDKENNRFMQFTSEKGARIRLGNSRCGRENYVVESIDAAKGTALLRTATVRRGVDATVDQLGNRMLVTADGMIPEEVRLIPVQAEPGK